VVDHELLVRVSAFLEREEYRSGKSISFRNKRQALCKAKANGFKLSKNKNRQDAAKKRVRDPNGKFQGGLLYRRPRIIFKIEKVNRNPYTSALAAPPSVVNFRQNDVEVNSILAPTHPRS
jgi:hypothetical protein